MTASSCQDWLTVYPQTQVVEENFWEDKNDLEGVRYAAYKQMCSTVDKMANWGELRSDNFQNWPRTQMSGGFRSTAESYSQMRSGQLEKDSANTYFSWSGFYTTINYCNKVLQHGDEVQSKDPQFTQREWQQMKAEMVGLRSLNYFYLLRAFKDIPYTTRVINNDSEVQYYSTTNQLVVLDSLIADLEPEAGKARNRFTNLMDTKGLITNAAIYALLSDMYLWRASLHEGRDIMRDQVVIHQQGGRTVSHTVKGDYQLAADYAKLSMEKLADQVRMSNNISASYDLISFGLPAVNLIKNDFMNFSDSEEPRVYAQEEIFYRGNSDESIFELQFNKDDNLSNGIVVSLYGTENTQNNDRYFAASKDALTAAYGSAGETYFSRDARMWFYAQTKIVGRNTVLDRPCIFKWQAMEPKFSGASRYPKGSDVYVQHNEPTGTGKDQSHRNWIVYRLSDVMLQRAEALVCLHRLNAGETSEDDANTGNDNLLTEAMQLVHALHRRWYCNDNNESAYNIQPVYENMTKVGADSWGTVDNNTANANFGNLPRPQGVLSGVDIYEVAVMNERQLEFIGEGKRWFDLVRFAERHAGGQDGTKDPREYTDERPIGNGRAGVDLMLDQFMKNQFRNEVDIMKTRFANRYGLYNLIYYKEIQAGYGALQQNPVWNKSIYDL